MRHKSRDINQANKTGARTNGSKLHEHKQRAGIPVRYADISFRSIEDMLVPLVAAGAYVQVKKYADNMLENLKCGTGLLLKGNTGTMKTTLAVAVANECLQANEHGCLFVTITSLMDTLSIMRAGGIEELARYERKLRRVPLLILDDLGAEGMQQYSQDRLIDKLDSIITERYNNMKATIITSNLTIEEMKSRYPERLLDRVRSTSLVVNFEYQTLREVPT